MPLASATWDETQLGLWLRLSSQRALQAGRCLLLTCDELTDVAGNPLDGNHDAVAGDDFRRAYTVVRSDRLVNPNVDTDPAGWTTIATGMDAS